LAILFLPSIRALAEPEPDLAALLGEKTSQLEVIRRQREQLRAQRTKVDRQLAELRARVREMNEQVATERSLVERLERGAQNGTAQPAAREEIITTAVRGVRLVVESLRSRARAGAAASRGERLDRVTLVADRLNSADPIQRGEALVDLWAFFEEELRQARTIELRNDAVIFDDGKLRKDAYRVRIGLVAELLVAEDGSMVAVGSSQESDGWSRRLAPTDERQVKRAVYVLRHRIPELVSVPFAVSAQGRDPVRLADARENSVAPVSGDDVQP
jgi:hypothetical protein